MQTEPRREHKWLERMVGEWTSESECLMGPDQPPSKYEGVEVIRSLGGLWTIGEAESGMPDGDAMKSVMTLGFDPARGKFVGTFIASCMGHLWSYEGELNEAGDTLALAAEGPSFTGEGTARYIDSIQIVDDDHRVMTSKVQGADGEWVHFMTMKYTRKAS
jgi:hypothetical protein